MRSTTLIFASALLTAVSATTYEYNCHGVPFQNDPNQWKDEASFLNLVRQDMTQIQHADDTQVTDVINTVSDYAKNIGMDKRFALAIMMRESSGNIHSECGDEEHSCGLYQVKDGNVPNTHVPSCYQKPVCPKETTDKMIQCGLVGCDNGYANVKQCWQKYPNNYGATARCFNAGYYTPVVLQDLSQGGGVPSYAQDVGNILIGASSGSIPSEQWGQMSCHWQ
ncbi:MAG: hypothetical protein Q9160_001101 [Pyrenula sp. 1 TL-2023]